jgi:hypothetical protein
MSEKNVNLFITSDNIKTENQSNRLSNFKIELTKNELFCKKDEGIKISVKLFNALNDIYNVIDGKNNYFTINLAGNITDHFIPSGNYNVINLMEWLNNELTLLIEIVWNDKQNTYTYKKLNVNPVSITSVNAGQFLGLPDGAEIVLSDFEDYTSDMLDMTYRKSIILKMMNAQIETTTIENINNYKQLENSNNIIFWISRQDIAPFKTIQYINPGDAFTYNLYNRNITDLHFKLVDENGREYMDISKLSLHIQITVYNRELTKKQLKFYTDMMNIFNDIYTLILTIMEFYNII